MERLFHITLQNRKILLNVLANTPKDILLKIPTGFNNNIWWNIAHVVVTQQLLLYKLSGETMRVSDALVDKFKKGTKPDGTATDAEINEVKNLLETTITWAEEDYSKGLFNNYNEYTTSANVTLKSKEDAVAFNIFHEGIHLGSILALKRALAV